MSGRGEGRQEPRDTLLLYCPYDRRVTRHARRGAEQEVVCLECGRPVDVSQPEGEGQPGIYDQRTTRFSPVVEPPPARRSQARPRPRRAGTSWLPLAIVAAALIVGVFAAVNVAGNLAAPAETIVTPARQSTTAPSPQSVQPGQPAPSAQASPGPQLAQTVRIANTGGEGAYIRRTTNLDDRLRAWPDNTQLRVVGPDTTVNGTQWKQIQDPAGNQGWIPTEYTRPE